MSGTDSLIAVAVTPSDTVDFARKTKALYVGGTGDVALISNGVVVTYIAVVAGTTLWVASTRINDTNTDATNMVALFAE